MPGFYSRNIIFHCFNIYINEGESGIGYNIIIGRYLMVQLGLMEYFKCQVLQWDFSAVPMKEPISFLGQDN